MSAGEWGFWIAVATLVAGVGKFIDDHHIKTATKSNAREVLVRWFVWLDSASVPDLGAAVLRPVTSLFRWRIGVSLLFLVGSYLAVTTVFYLWRLAYGPHPGNYFSYVIFWLAGASQVFWYLFMAAILAAALAGSWVMAFLVSRATQARSSRERTKYLISALVFGPLTSVLLELFFVLIATGFIGPYGWGLLWAVVLSPMVPLMFVSLVLILMALRTLIKVNQWVLLHIFDSASSPSASPFAYASALLGLAILTAKVAQAAVS